MIKIWLILGLASIDLALYGYLDQELRCHTHWDWTQFWHHETLVGIEACVGIALLTVAITENIRRR